MRPHQARRLDRGCAATTTAVERLRRRRCQPTPSRLESLRRDCASADRRRRALEPAPAPASGSSALRPTRGSSRSAEPAPAEQRVAAARAGRPARSPASAGVLSAATQSGSIRVARAPRPASRAASVGDGRAAARSESRAAPSRRRRTRAARSARATTSRARRDAPRRRPAAARRRAAAGRWPSASTQAQRHAHGDAGRVDADAGAAGAASRVGADQDVLAVVEHAAVQTTSRARGRPSCGAISNSVTRVPARRRLDRGGEPGPAGADDGDRRPASHQRPAPVRAHRDPELAQRRQRDALVQHLEVVGLDLAQQRAVDVGHHQPGLLRARGRRRAAARAPRRSVRCARSAWNCISAVKRSL